MDREFIKRRLKLGRWEVNTVIESREKKKKKKEGKMTLTLNSRERGREVGGFILDISTCESMQLRKWRTKAFVVHTHTHIN